MPSCCCLGARPNLQPSTLEVDSGDGDGRQMIMIAITITLGILMFRRDPGYPSRCCFSQPMALLSSGLSSKYVLHNSFCKIRHCDYFRESILLKKEFCENLQQGWGGWVGLHIFVSENYNLCTTNKQANKQTKKQANKVKSSLISNFPA